MALSLLPCPVIWFGMTILHSALWSILLLHITCLIPGIIWGRSLWKDNLKPPTKKQTLILIASSVFFCSLALVVYEFLGEHLMDSRNTLALIMHLGYKKSIIYPLGIYFVFVNATLEELFWRGVMFTKMDQLERGSKGAALAWTSITYAIYHYSILRLILYPGWAEFGVLFLATFGAILAITYKRTRSIWLISMYHAFLTDLAAIVLIVALFCRLQIPGML